jgi:hypothetical protein
MAGTGSPLASCAHCRAILLWTPEGLVHPMPGEREPIRARLGTSWFAHASTPFDGRFHQCLGTARDRVAPGSGRAVRSIRRPA